MNIYEYQYVVYYNYIYIYIIDIDICNRSIQIQCFMTPIEPHFLF